VISRERRTSYSAELAGSASAQRFLIAVASYGDAALVSNRRPELILRREPWAHSGFRACGCAAGQEAGRDLTGLEAPWRG